MRCFSTVAVGSLPYSPLLLRTIYGRKVLGGIIALPPPAWHKRVGFNTSGRYLPAYARQLLYKTADRLRSPNHSFNESTIRLGYRAAMVQSAKILQWGLAELQARGYADACATCKLTELLSFSLLNCARISVHVVYLLRVSVFFLSPLNLQVRTIGQIC